VKWDGVRLLADTTGPRLRLLSRNGRDATVAYPELAGLATLGGAVLDGEVVAMSAGIPSFEALAERMHVRDAARARALAERAPVTYLVFDVLQLYGVDLTHRSFDERRATLERLALPEHVQLSPVYPDGADLWEVTLEHGLEGVLAKRRTSTYQPGRRSPDWLKLKVVRGQELVIGGWTDPQGARTGLGALLLGYYEGDELRYAGKVGTGFDARTLRQLQKLLAPLARKDNPFAEDAKEIRRSSRTGPAQTHWVEPHLVAQIGFGEWTSGGRLRHPRYQGLREDKDPRDVVREEPHPIGP
jgi:bifunctional non-homologous end joining protein LigD